MLTLNLFDKKVAQLNSENLQETWQMLFLNFLSFSCHMSSLFMSSAIDGRNKNNPMFTTQEPVV